MADKLTGSSVLDTSKTPAEWIEVLAERNIVYTERALRNSANRLELHMKDGSCWFHPYDGSAPRQLKR